MLSLLLIACAGKSQTLPALSSLANDTLCLKLDAIRELVTLAEQGIFEKADKVKLAEDNDNQRKAIGQFRVALEKAELEIFNIRKAIDYSNAATAFCEEDKAALKVQIEKERKQTKRAKTGQKVVGIIGLIGIGAALAL